MSDVERICQRNHEMRKWAEEVEEKHDPSVSFADSSPCAGEPARNDRREAVRTAVLACAMAAGGGAAFAGMGLAMGHMATIVVGVVAALAFGMTGISLERKER